MFILIREIERVVDYMEQIQLVEYWDGFSAVAYAFYNQEVVYLFNHPHFPLKSKSFTQLDWSEDFNGADCLILFQEYPTAIINMNNHQDIESLYSILVHVLFHGYQFLLEEKRFPNEVLGFQYPLVKENIEWRNKERLALYHAVIEDEQEHKKQYIREFISYREKRKSMIGEFLDYENLVETVEGTAWLVELQAKHRVSTQTWKEVLDSYSNFLIDSTSSTLHIRRSCYASGLFICLILNDIAPDWKSHFLHEEKSLYDIFKEYVTVEPRVLEEEQISRETDEIFLIAKKKKDDVFANFLRQDGYKLVIEGQIKTVSFDPMNIIYEENRVLHQSNVKVKLNEQEYLIQQPVLAYFNEDYKNAIQLELFSANKPSIVHDVLHINGIGEIQGEITESINAVRVKVL